MTDPRHEARTRDSGVVVRPLREGDLVEADRILREEICNRSDDGEAPMELSERTKTIISTHGWLAS